jgi:hypothetical protein
MLEPDESEDARAFSVSPTNIHLKQGQSRRIAVTFRTQRHLSYEAFVEGVQTLCAECHHITLRLLDKPNGTEKEVFFEGAFHPHAGPPPTPILPLRVALSGTCQPAMLNPDQLDTLYWTVHRIHNAATHSSFAHTVTLSNTGRCPLAFKLAVEGPFQLIEATTSVPQLPERFEGSTFFTPTVASQGGPVDAWELFLPPWESVDVKLRLLMDTTAPWKDLDIVGTLVVAFLNGEAQNIPLEGRVLHPRLEARLVAGVAADKLDFGRVHVRSLKTLDIVLTNPTLVDALWHVLGTKAGVQGSAASQDVPHGAPVAFGAFEFSSGHGKLQGMGLGKPRCFTICVSFAPAECRIYEVEIEIRLLCGETLWLVVCGEGTFDERDEFQGHLTSLYQ